MDRAGTEGGGRWKELVLMLLTTKGFVPGGPIRAKGRARIFILDIDIAWKRKGREGDEGGWWIDGELFCLPPLVPAPASLMTRRLFVEKNACERGST